jgi:murein DD-endopeptidase MepM/ murein hydrolase activator NlpD
MRLSRRRFLSGSLMCAPAFLLRRLPIAAASASPDKASALVITNFNVGNRAAIVEGRTLLAVIGFPQPVAAIDGSLPVEITPAAAGGAVLIEPQPLSFYPLDDRAEFATILSAPLDARHNTMAEMQLRARSQSADEPFTTAYEIVPGDYRASHLTLSTDFSSPSVELRERMRRDFETMVEVYRRRTPRRWRDAFIHPVSCSHRNNFGDRRVVNGTKRYRHAGLDYNAPLGTSVRAMNDGRVALSTEQWVPGQTICIDHGGGVFTKYLHLSARHVREGMK